MKSHISATIDQELLRELDKFGQEERRARSQIIEMALEEFLLNRERTHDDIVTSQGRFVDQFSREETYAR